MDKVVVITGGSAGIGAELAAARRALVAMCRRCSEGMCDTCWHRGATGRSGSIAAPVWGVHAAFGVH